MAETKYYGLYNHFKKLILSGTMEYNTKMPSIRDCSRSYELSRTTVETAYEMLCAEGYIYPVPQSGFYVCNVIQRVNESVAEQSKSNIKFNFVNSSADKDAFNFALWRKYVKSALRQDERLLSYGESQGEEDLRNAIALYVNKQRGLICSPSQIVVGAGTQSLIGILCAITSERKTVAFIGSNFSGGQAVFEDYNKVVTCTSRVENYNDELKNNTPSIIYTSPSHTDAYGSVMTVGQRRELLEFEKQNDCLIIEDDYDSEFRYSSRPVPPLQSMNGGENVVYLGTFSKLLIPSLRISFMVLPFSLLERYNARKVKYNQTASKAEQIALCQYIRDGHLGSRIKKQKKQFAQKTDLICSLSKEKLNIGISFEKCEAVYLIQLVCKNGISADEISEKAEKNGMLIRPVSTQGRTAKLLLSVAGFDMNDFDEVVQIINKICS